MSAKNPNRATITLEIEKGKIVKVTGSHGDARKVSSKEVETLVRSAKQKTQVRPRAGAALVADGSPCFAFIWFAGKWVKVPVPCA
jgi:hypothetical protein